MALREVFLRWSLKDPVSTDGSTAVPFQFTRINAAANTTTQIVAAQGASKKIRILGYAFGVSNAGVVTFQDSTGTPVVFAEFDLVKNGGAVYSGGFACPAFDVSTNKDFVILTPATVVVKGHVTWCVV